MEEERYYIGVDVGTGSVRAALLSPHDNREEKRERGVIQQVHVLPITTLNPKTDYYEQSGEEIWEQVIQCVKEVSKGIDKKKIRGIGFDATCSLVVLSSSSPVPLLADREKEKEKEKREKSVEGKTFNVILWMDHRAEEIANEINEKAKREEEVKKVLSRIGGKISPEMEIPKLIWLKRNLPEAYQKATHFLDLADFLTWKATGKYNRSSCTLACKWGFFPDFIDFKENPTQRTTKGWNKFFLESVGLSDLVVSESATPSGDCVTPHTPIGDYVTIIGSSLGPLCCSATEELCLGEHTQVGVGLIDAHAGALGLLGCGKKEDQDQEIEKKEKDEVMMGLVCGTSSCHMVLTESFEQVDGVWGPFHSAILPGRWVLEGGQSATGGLLDSLFLSHPVGLKVLKEAEERRIHPSQIMIKKINLLAEQQQQRHPLLSFLTTHTHTTDTHHGCRSPLADPSLRGSVCGLGLDAGSEDKFAILYLATVQAIAYGTKHIIDQISKNGIKINKIAITGGLAHNNLFVRELGGCCNADIIIPSFTKGNAVVLGAGMLGATGSGDYSLSEATTCFSPPFSIVSQESTSPELKEYHKKKYQVYLKMLKDQKCYQTIMNSCGEEGH